MKNLHQPKCYMKELLDTRLLEVPRKGVSCRRSCTYSWGIFAEYRTRYPKMEYIFVWNTAWSKTHFSSGPCYKHHPSVKDPKQYSTVLYRFWGHLVISETYQCPNRAHCRLGEYPEVLQSHQRIASFLLGSYSFRDARFWMASLG